MSLHPFSDGSVEYPTTKAAHTPGPWHVSSQGQFVRYRLEKSGGFPYNVCAMEVFGGPEDEREANARLIAVAPEMLEALEAVMRFCPTYPGEVEVAVRKARGNQ
jgi:hypothetical protein